MENEDILSALQNIFRSVLFNSSIVLDMKSNTASIEEWDSLTHVELIYSIEQHFNIKFSSREILSWKNIEQMVTYLRHKIQSPNIVMVVSL